MSTLKVFDPPMCCTSGVCGSEPDPTLARFAADLKWLQLQGISIERYTLSQQPDKFTAEPAVLSALTTNSTAALPIVMLDGQIVAARAYPSREQLTAIVGLAAPLAAESKGKSGGGCCCGPSGCC